MAEDNQNIEQEERGIRGQLGDQLEKKIDQVNKTLKESIGISNSLVDTLKEALGINIRRTTADSNLLNINKRINQAIQRQVEEFESISSLQKQISKNTKLIEESERVYGNIYDIIKATNASRLEGADEAVKEISTLQKLTSYREDLNRRIEEGISVDRQGKNITDESIKSLDEIIKRQDARVDKAFETLKPLQQQYVATKLNTDALKEQNEVLESVNKTLEGSEFLSDLLSKIPGISPLAKRAIADVQKEAIKVRRETGEIPKNFSAATKFAKNLGKEILDKISSPFSLILLALDQLISAFRSVDKEAAQLAKTFNLTYEEAVGIRQELVRAADASNELFVTSKALQETLGALNAAVGTRTFSGLSNELQQSVVFLTKLREESAVTAEQLQVLAELTFVTGQNTEDITANLLGAVEVFAARQGLIINEKDLFKQIEQFSKATLLTLSQTPYRIGEAVAEARSLGTTLSQVEAISGTIVNFQSSIQDELAAQVLTGRALNLNAARLAALNNDTATVAKEIREQIGGAAEFGRLNRIQQEAVAKAIGVGRDEMAKMLLVQKQIAGLQGEEAERRQKAVELLIKQRGIDGAITQAGQAQIRRLEKQVSLQEQFTASVEKLKEVFVDIATIIGPILQPVVESIGAIAEGMRNTESAISALKGIGAGAGIGGAIGAALGTFVAPGVGTAAGFQAGASIGGFLGAGAAAVDDGYFPPVGGEGYDRALLTPEGTFKLNNDDNIIAGTDNSIRPRIPRTGYTTQITPITNVSNTTTQPISSQNVTNLTSTQAVDMSELVSTMKKSNELIEQQTKTLAEGQDAIRKQKQNLVVGATNLGTQLNTYSYRVQYG